MYRNNILTSQFKIYYFFLSHLSVLHCHMQSYNVINIQSVTITVTFMLKGCWEYGINILCSC